jgi:hypothetical protein
VRLKEAGRCAPAFICVAESALVTEDNLKELGEEEYFIIR